eukprot:Skav221550  [mRNA]  locus=scaffold1376:49954:53308:- [translate_table: standard]
MNDFYDDFGLSEAEIKRLSTKHAREMLPKSCTLEDKLGDLAVLRWTIRHRLRLPELVRVQILEFYPTAQVQLRGQRLLGLHNGHVYYFKSFATSRAADLMCRYKCQDLSVAEYCVQIGCPVSPQAPVIKASRYLEDMDFLDEVSVLPSEFAVLAPENTSPCGSMLDLFESSEDWFEDAEVSEDLSDEEMESENDSESDNVVRNFGAPAPKASKIERQSQTLQCREILPQDRELYWAVTGVRDGDKNVRQLLRAGANPTAPVNPSGIAEAQKSAVSLATEFMESSMNYLDQLLKRQFCPHQARGWKSIRWSYLYAFSIEEVREEAQAFLEKLEEQKESVALLRTAEAVWETAVPSKRMHCSENFLCGRGVSSPDLEVLDSSIATIPKAEASMISNEAVCRLADCMWDLAQQNQNHKNLCCREAEVQAMGFEENTSRQVELKERRAQQAREKALQREKRQADAARYGTMVPNAFSKRRRGRRRPSTGSPASGLGLGGRISGGAVHVGLGSLSQMGALPPCLGAPSRDITRTSARLACSTLRSGIGRGLFGISSPVCCYFLQGRCRFGEDCRFSHDDDQDGPCQFGDGCWLGHGDEL